MKKPVLDHRTQSDVLEQVRARAASYTPEWRCDGDLSDPGMALATVFSEMYTHTLDRFNRLPQKYYTEFLNQLGVSAPDVVSASGYVRFDIHPAAERAVVVPEHTLLGAAGENKGENILFETDTRIEATPARLVDIFYVDTKADLLQKLDLTRPGQTLFGAVEGENLSQHTLLLSQNEVLAVEGACFIQVELHQKAQFQDEMLVKTLADTQRVSWSWFNGETWIPFDEVSDVNGRILLHKRSEDPFAPDEEGRLLIRCRMFRPEGDIRIEEIRLSSAPEGDSLIEGMAFGDLPLEDGKGYCFGRRPSIYDLFYLRSDRVFCKRGTEVTLQITISTEAENPDGEKVQYDWNQLIINKDESAPIIPDDVMIRRVIWEYYNGEGWAPLQVSGDSNPFLPEDSIKKHALTFHIPENIHTVAVNAQEGYYIRARIAEMENALSLHPRWLLPYITEATCRWQYLQGCNCSYVSSINDGTECTINDASNVNRLQLQAFYPTETNGRSLYFHFDRSPDAMPLTMLLQMRHNGVLPGKVSFEAMRDGKFYPAHVTDGTGNFSYTGLIALHLPDPLTSAQLFGAEGFWIRATCEGSHYREELLPKLDAIDVNVSPVVQRQQAEEQYFDTEPYAKRKEIQLLLTPVQNAEVWINETKFLSTSELQTLRTLPHALREEKTSGGEVQYWVRWQRAADLRLADGSERAYELDTASGKIRFGDDIHGRIPPEGADNICVYYANGGGTAGNLPAGAITNLIDAIPMADSVTNVTATCGGTNGGTDEWLEDVGTMRLRHRDRAMGISDYENMVRQNFPRVHRVKCFAGFDEQGNRAPGHVMVVFLCAEATNLADTTVMAKQIYLYLCEHSDCLVVSAHRLHVMPAMEIRVSVEAQLELKNLDRAADTQQQINSEITSLIDGVWRQRGIGQALHTEELYELLSQAPNVALVRQVLIRGSYVVNGVERACNLEEEHNLPYAAVRSGNHTIRVM